MTPHPMRGILFMAWGLLVIVVALAFLLGRPIWVLDAVFAGACLGCAYFFRKALNLTRFLFILIVGIGIAHSFAVTGLYGRTFWGVEYDSVIHAYASIVLGMTAYHYTRKFNVSRAEAAAVGMLLTLGLGLFNEIVEFAGYRIGGRGEGFFLLGPGDIGAENAFDNLMTDFVHDFVGGAVGVGLAVVWHICQSDKKQS